eukprot:6188296-Pleurochrysis_carterae.AAC.4
MKHSSSFEYRVAAPNGRARMVALELLRPLHPRTLTHISVGACNTRGGGVLARVLQEVPTDPATSTTDNYISAMAAENDMAARCTSFYILVHTTLPVVETCDCRRRFGAPAPFPRNHRIGGADVSK